MKPLPILAILLLSATAQASECTITGTFFGMTVQNGIDLDGDGSNGRSGYFVATGGTISHIWANVDTTYSPTQGCPTGQVEIVPSGQAVFTTRYGHHAIFVEIDSSHHLCAGGPPESIVLIITGGRGMYAGATGSGTATLPDDFVALAQYGFPQVIYTHDGEFELSVD
jgi:hypothetical protein